MSFKEEFCLFMALCLAVSLVIFALIGDIWYYIFGMLVFLTFAIFYAWYNFEYKRAKKKDIYMNEIPVNSIRNTSMVHPETFSINGSFTSHD